jgi:hypothetical protein
MSFQEKETTKRKTKKKQQPKKKEKMIEIIPSSKLVYVKVRSSKIASSKKMDDRVTIDYDKDNQITGIEVWR